MRNALSEHWRELARLVEDVMHRDSEPLERAAEVLSAALKDGRRIHLVSDARCRHLASHLANLWHEGDDTRGLPVRSLFGAAAQGGQTSRSIQSFVDPEDVVLALALEAPRDLDDCLRLARARRARVVGVLAEDARPLGEACHEAVVLPRASLGLASEGVFALASMLGTAAVTRCVDVRSTRARRALDGPGSTSSRVGARSSAVGRAAPESGYESGARARSGPESAAVPRPTVGSDPGPKIHVTCRSCGEPLTFVADEGGRSGRCPHCLAGFRIPAAPTSGDAPPRAGRASDRVPRGGGRRSERRRAPRLRIRDGWVRWSDSDYPGSSGEHPPHMIEDLSLTGMRFRTRESEFQVGDVYSFSLDLPPVSTGPLCVRGQIRRVLRLRRGQGFAAGVRFVGYAQESDRTRLREALEDMERGGAPVAD